MKLIDMIFLWLLPEEGILGTRGFMGFSYKDAGVDIEKGNNFIKRIETFIKSTYTDRVVGGVGGFCALYDMGDRYLASGADGVGTKLKLAQQLDVHDTIGIDLVAMCVNDILCCGAKPLFFLDYFSCGKLDVEVGESVVRGIVEGCKKSECALIGGETAEMPGIYTDGEYDLAGFAVGEVFKNHVLDGKRVCSGDYIIALPSSGFHSNGFSLIRKLIDPKEKKLLQACLRPTKIYTQEILALLEQFEADIHGLAHITGGGLDNIKRINSHFDYTFSEHSFIDRAPDFMQEIFSRSGLSHQELMKTFNMGIGFVVVTANLKVCDFLEGSYLLGRVI